MKAYIDLDKMEIVMDNEAIKAIRFCLGLNPDLRVKLSKNKKEYVYRYCSENTLALFGSSMVRFNNDPEKYEKIIYKAVYKILEGRC